MANRTSFQPDRPLTPERVGGVLTALRDGVLRGKVEVEDLGSAWVLRWSGAPDRSSMALSLDEDGLSWPHQPNQEDEWLIQCVGSCVARGIDPEAMLGDEGIEERFRADFDRRYPTLRSWLTRPTGHWLLDVVNGAIHAFGRNVGEDAPDMSPAPF